MFSNPQKPENGARTEIFPPFNNFYAPSFKFNIFLFNTESS
jgi:hypothetical protein